MMLIVLPNKPERFFPRLPDEYGYILGPGNVLIATWSARPVKYLDESAMQWRVLDRHISEVVKRDR